MCRNVTAVAGTHAWKSKKKTSLPATSKPTSVPSHSSKTSSFASSSQSHASKSNVHPSKDSHAKKAISKEVQAKDEKQRLLASMLKASTQPSAKKPTIVVGGAKPSGPPNANSGPSAKPSAGKKSLFSFLNSLS